MVVHTQLIYIMSGEISVGVSTLNQLMCRNEVYSNTYIFGTCEILLALLFLSKKRVF